MPQNKKYKYTERAIAALRPSCASYVERKSYVTLRRPTSTSLTKSHTHVFNELIRWTQKKQKLMGPIQNLLFNQNFCINGKN